MSALNLLSCTIGGILVLYGLIAEVIAWRQVAAPVVSGRISLAAGVVLIAGVALLA